MLAYTYIRKEKSRITWPIIKRTIFLAFFFVSLSSGLLSVGQKTVPSGMAAILYATAPVLFMLADWIFWKGERPSKTQGIGLVLGIFAMFILNFQQIMSADTSLFGVACIFVSVLSFIYGSHLSMVYRGNDDLSVIRSSGLTLFIGGIITMLLALLLGERVDFFAMPGEAYFLLTFIVLSSTITGYTCYLWLLYNTRVAVAISYEYIAPVVAVALGVFFAGESIDSLSIMASFVLLASVFLITTHGKEH